MLDSILNGVFAFSVYFLSVSSLVSGGCLLPVSPFFAFQPEPEWKFGPPYESVSIFVWFHVQYLPCRLANIV